MGAGGRGDLDQDAGEGVGEDRLDGRRKGRPWGGGSGWFELRGGGGWPGLLLNGGRLPWTSSIIVERIFSN